jgi:hypothetical protein
VWSIAVIALLGALVAPRATAQSREPEEPSANPATGIVTDRLSPRQRGIWRAIKQLILAVDAAGKPLHPTLYALWEQVETGPHTIYLEFDEDAPATHLTQVAGRFQIECLDPQGIRHVATIRLHLKVIDRAHTRALTGRDAGFSQLAGLNRLERYAEVLGHELAHAADVLSDPGRVQMLEELVEQTNESINQSLWRKAAIAPELEQRIMRRDAFLKELEERARTVEEAVWRELLESQTARKDRKVVALAR